jgi:hypothetical protein
VILIGGASWIDKGNAVKDIKERVMRLAKNDAIYMLSEQVFRLLYMMRIGPDRANIVRDSYLESIEILDPDLGQVRKVQLKIVAANGQDGSITLAEICQNVLALNVSCVDDDLDLIQEIEYVLWDSICPFPVCVGKDCNSHSGIPPY